MIHTRCLTHPALLVGGNSFYLIQVKREKKKKFNISNYFFKLAEHNLAEAIQSTNGFQN